MHESSMSYTGRSNVSLRQRTGTRRDCFAESHIRLAADPSAWGYETTSEGQLIRPKRAGSISPFTLHLIGEHVGEVTWPPELENVIQVHSGLEYQEYYDVLASMASRNLSNYLDTAADSRANYLGSARSCIHRARVPN